LEKEAKTKREPKRKAKGKQKESKKTKRGVERREETLFIDLDVGAKI
jgi:hypothetical protein